MQQITVLTHIARRYRLNGSKRMIGLFLLYSLMIDFCCARGPHHPRGGVKRRAEQQKHINEHLAFESQHIQEDIDAQHLPVEKKVEEMTEEERSYLFFKVHDLDGNGKLDGLEIFYSATHHAAEHEHDYDLHGENSEIQETEEHAEETHGDEDEKQDTMIDRSNDSSTTSDIQSLNLIESDVNEQISHKNVNHIIEVLDNFLSLADLNDDGYLNYAEYAAAVKIGNENVEEQNAEL